MKKNVLAALAVLSLLECLPHSLASTSPVTRPTPSTKRKGLWGRLSSGTEQSKNGTSDESGGDDEVTDEKKKRSPWQFLNRKNEDVPESGGDDEVTDEKKKKSPWQFLNRKNDDASTDEDISNEDKLENEGKKKEDGASTDEASENSEEDDDRDDDEANSDKSSPTSEEEEEDDDDEKSDENGEEDTQQEEESEKNESKSKQSQDPIQQYQNQMLQRQRFMSPGTIVYRSVPSTFGNPMQQENNSPGMPNGQAMAAAAVINLLSLASRLFFLKWIINKLAFESESVSPVQHFMWECLNDKYVKDNQIWNRVLNRVPQSMGVSQQKWKKTLKSMRPEPVKHRKKDRPWKKRRIAKKKATKNEQLIVSSNDNENNQNSTETKPQSSPETSKMVVVVDFSTVNTPHPDFLRFADVVTFLVSANKPQKNMFGKSPEIVLLLQSPGGEVTSFAFAAAQVARLRDAGWNVTVCVDRIAASGGYMIASQATQILASPFAMVGSVGVITESLNFYEILKRHGIQSLVLKAGDSKNPLTQFGKVTDENLKQTQKDLDETHESFINLCRSRRPSLDPAVCNGRILSGDMALEKGMIDRILTSDEYVLEKISEGDLVMKLHLVSGNSERHMIANALQILPHLTSRFKKFVFAGGDKSLVGKMNASIDGNFASKAFQIVGLASMIRRAIMRAGFFGKQ